MNPVRTMLVCSGRLSCESMKGLLTHSRFHILWEARDLAEAGQMVAGEVYPELIIVDLVTVETSSMALLVRLRRKAADAKVVVLTNELTVWDIGQTLRAEVDACLTTNISLEAFVDHLALVWVGERVMSYDLLEQFVYSQAARKIDTQPALTGREFEVLSGLVTGQSNKQIARSLAISDATVAVHVKGILKKLNVANRTQAALWGNDHGMRADTGAKRVNLESSPGPRSKGGNCRMVPRVGVPPVCGQLRA